MIIVYHRNKLIIRVIDNENGNELPIYSVKLTILLFELCYIHKDKIIIWCDISLENNLNLELINEIFHHKKIFATFSASGKYSLSNFIQYVDHSFFCNPNRKVSFPTYFMSSEVGGIHSSILNKIGDSVKDEDFDYFICSLAKVAIPCGLLCYSEPKLLKNNIEIKTNSFNSLYRDFRFIAQHWKKKWIFFFFLNLLIYERKLPIYQLISTLFLKKKNIDINSLDEIRIQSSNNSTIEGTFDVIIPTIGRKKYLFDFLLDLSQQTKLPSNVIIVEQNPVENSSSELDYLLNNKFPFKIRHIFTHQTGACNARNLALAETKSEWVFLADDDIRIDKSFLEIIFENLIYSKVNALNVSCLQLNQKRMLNKIVQSNIFGSGCSVINKRIVENLKFDIKFEHGFGEDNDFGMQIRNLGFDILYFPEPEILHLKAPVGGFRTKPILQWSHELIAPKPSPTIMLFNLKNNTPKQISGYKTLLAINCFNLHSIYNPIKFLRHFNHQWDVSVFWANKLMKE